jgi:pimeloyl-ACP methyl ester carboxylesterase
VAAAVFVGCSQGGASSIDLALSQPSRVGALVLVSPGLTIVAGIPGCRKIDVPGGDHLLPLRVPGLVADTIAELAG